MNKFSYCFVYISVVFGIENKYTNMYEICYSISLKEKLVYFNFYETAILLEHTKFKNLTDVISI